VGAVSGHDVSGLFPDLWGEKLADVLEQRLRLLQLTKLPSGFHRRSPERVECGLVPAPILAEDGDEFTPKTAGSLQQQSCLE
jgi:hypothetical protein